MKMDEDRERLIISYIEAIKSYALLANKAEKLPHKYLEVLMQAESLTIMSNILCKVLGINDENG